MLQIFTLKVSILWRLGWADVAHRCYGNVHSDTFAVTSLFNAAGFSWFKAVSTGNVPSTIQTTETGHTPCYPIATPSPRGQPQWPGEEVHKISSTTVAGLRQNWRGCGGECGGRWNAGQDLCVDPWHPALKNVSVCNFRNLMPPQLCCLSKAAPDGSGTVFTNGRRG